MNYYYLLAFEMVHPKILFVIFCCVCILCTCKKDISVQDSIHYKLGGLYVRDSAVVITGIKILNLTTQGNYCWTTDISGSDSSYCNGTWTQTSDTTLLWKNEIVIAFNIKLIDTIPKGMLLQLKASAHDTAALFGYYH